MNSSMRPLASLIILFYKQEQFVKDTVSGALSQTYENLEIIISDDCSPDNTFSNIQQAVQNYHGPHKIILNRNDKNIGLVPHVNKALFELSHGKYIFLNGGDDISLPDRVKIGVKAFEENPRIDAVTFSSVIIDQGGVEKGKIETPKDVISIIDDKYLMNVNFMAGLGALSIRRLMLDTFGSLSDDCQTEDSVLRFRALLTGGILCKKEFGLQYRVHDNNISRLLGNFKTELIAQQYRRDLEIMKDSISVQLYEALTNKIDFYIKFRNIQVAYEKEESRIKKIFFRFQMYRLKSKYLKKFVC